MDLKAVPLKNWLIVAAAGGLLLWVAVDHADKTGASSIPAVENASNADDTEVAVRPSFAMDEAGVAEMISQIGPDWKDPILTMSHHDSLTNGQSISYNYKRRSASLFTLPDGRVWRIRLNVGWGDFCGDKSDIRHATEALVNLLSPGTDPKPLFTGARSDTVVVLTAPKADLRVGGRCVTMITATAS
jgi:hypothetical protein